MIKNILYIRNIIEIKISFPKMTQRDIIYTKKYFYMFFNQLIQLDNHFNFD